MVHNKPHALWLKAECKAKATTTTWLLRGFSTWQTARTQGMGAAEGSMQGFLKA